MPTLNEAKRRYSEYSLLYPAAATADTATTATVAALKAKFNEMSYWLNVNSVTPSATGFPTGTVVSNAQTGNGNSTVFDFGNLSTREPVFARVTAAIGATPTCTYDIQSSNDNSTWAAVSRADSATPTTFNTSSWVMTTATTLVKIIPAGLIYRYLRFVYSANTNVTNTADIYPL
jgi:hypothetical protein